MNTHDIATTSEEVMRHAIQIISTWGLSVIGAILLLVFGYWLSVWAGRTTRSALTRAKMDAQLIPFFAHSVHYLVLAVVVIAVLQLFGIQTTSLVAIIGAAGLAVGLALQGTLSSFASGVLLLVMRPFKIGDFVVVAGSQGIVAELSLFTTTLNTPDNVRIIVPNSSVYGSTITNFSANDTRRIDLLVGISYDDDIGKAIEIIHGVLAADERVLSDPRPAVRVSELADSSVNLIVRPWVAAKDYGAARGDLTQAIKEEIEAGGCSFPFPQQDVHVVSAPDFQSTIAGS